MVVLKEQLSKTAQHRPSSSAFITRKSTAMAPLQYIVKRILIFIPTFFVISLLIFGLSKLAPGDPVLVVMGGSDSQTVGQRADLINSDQAYNTVAAQLGLDQPAFYFLLTSAAYPADLYKITKSHHRETLSRLIDAYGNANAVLAYYNELKSAQYKLADIEKADYKLKREANDYIEALYSEYDPGGIEYQLNRIEVLLEKMEAQTPGKSVTELRDQWRTTTQAYQTLLANPTPSKRYLPALRWYGTESQYHTWMFGDYPWFSQVDSSGHFRMNDLSEEIKTIVPKKRANDRTISRIRGQLKRTRLALEGAEIATDSLQKALDSLALQLQYYTTEQQTYQVQLASLAQERDSLSANVPHYSSKGFLRGDFGVSYIDKKTVAEKISIALYWTVIMNVFAIFIAYLISLPLGIRSAVWKLQGRKAIDNVNTTVLFVLYSLPSFWIGTLLLVFLTTSEYSPWLDWFPTSGAQDLDLLRDETATTWDRILDAAHHLVLPIFCITYGTLAYLSRQMRGSMLNVLRQDYIRTARAKGLPENKVVQKHGFRNALFPIITLFSSVFPRALSGAIAIELIYAIPGMGQLVLFSISMRDWPVVFTVVMFVAIMTMVGNLIADILYAIVDPRVSYK